MGNVLNLAICGLDQDAETLVDFDDISDASFDFISVAVCKPEMHSANSKVVAVVPVDLHAQEATKTISALYKHADEGDLTFNERLNMLTWDPEVTPATTEDAKPMDTFVFDEYSSCPINAPPIDTNLKRKKRSWIKRVVEKCSNNKQREHTTPSTNEPETCECDQPEFDAPIVEDEMPLVASYKDDEPLFDSYPASNFEDTCKWQFGECSDADDTEDSSSDSGSDGCSCYVRASSFDYGSEYEFDWETESSAEPPNAQETAADGFFSSQDAYCLHVVDYLCACGSCPAYAEIAKEVTNSNHWMNEQERVSLCRILQAYSTYNESVTFCKDMIAAAEECLLVMADDEDAAFNAFVLLAQAKWTV